MLHLSDDALQYDVCKGAAVALNWTRALAIGAALLGGLLAGMALDRVLVQFPAWRHVGVASWTSFTRSADLGRGLIIYPAVGLTALFLSGTAAGLTAMCGLELTRASRAPIYLAALLAITAFLVTRFALAGEMLSLRRIAEIESASRVFDHVTRWFAVKAMLHVATFIANVWSLAVLYRIPGRQ